MVYGPDDHAGAGVSKHGEGAAAEYSHMQSPGEPLLANLLDYSALKGKRVLEIGFGTGG
jgi:hypothetical protein